MTLHSLEALLRRDPGGRGVPALGQPGWLSAMSRALAAAHKVGIVTGYPAGPEAGETDGPPGAAALGAALSALGVNVTFVTDSLNAPLLAALEATPCVVLAAGQDANEVITQLGCSHLVAIEVPARAVCGRRRSMRGEDITEWGGDLDALFPAARAAGLVTCGIGDGGNEVGLGSLRERVIARVENGAAIASTVPTDHVLLAGVSTWGAYALVGALSVQAGRDLLPTAQTVRDQLERLVAVGAKDGVTRLAEPTIDGLPLQTTLDFLADVAAASSPI
ncbi:DUF4392 domain-containing protein [Planctomycetota bacterium]|nr:DUF4392 domain-containing protein [Planctomycetota bacterium]